MARFDEIYAASKRGPAECWPWQGTIDRRGYGKVGFRDTRTGKVVSWVASRAVWTTEHGPIPGDLTIDHLCFNPPCVNPAHLRLLTRSENSSLNRKAKWVHCPKGHPFDEENTIIRNARGHRRCRECQKACYRRYNAKRYVRGPMTLEWLEETR